MLIGPLHLAGEFVLADDFYRLGAEVFEKHGLERQLDRAEMTGRDGKGIEGTSLSTERTNHALDRKLPHLDSFEFLGRWRLQELELLLLVLQ